MTGSNPFDGIPEARRSTWSRLTQLRTASMAVTPHILVVDDGSDPVRDAAA